MSIFYILQAKIKSLNKSLLWNCALTLYRYANKTNDRNLCKMKHNVLNDLIKNKHVVSQRLIKITP